ncbi:uncharacterized protein LOC119647183 [Hermetia illucens]|uniref:uncharacterized protein LOC119647183 n=1 Tax=Hermetia illucens TaxID=343691 RepID=UPI0018CC75F9|nr:uncharacterized protein LOC119647183 [Hermetia illucens]
MSVGMAVAKRVSQPSPTSTVIVIGLGSAYDLPTKVDDWRWRLKFRNRTMNPPNKDKISIAESKNLINPYPSSTNIALELTAYHNMPGSIDDWRWRKPAKSKSVTSTTKKPSFTHITIAEAKNLINPYPSSTNIVLELTAYHDMPGSIDDWRWRKPAKLKNVTSTTKKPTMPPTMPPAHFYEDHDIIHESKPDFLISEPWSDHLHHNIWTSKPDYKDILLHKPMASHTWRKSYNTPYYWKPPKSNIYRKSRPRPIPAYEEWMDHPGHRERRQIFNSLEVTASKFGLDVKTCILRTICEAKHFLLPPGKSLIQDIIRILFDIPAHPHWKDEYSTATRHKEEDCRKVYGGKCPISVLEFMLNNQIDISKL